MRIDGETLLMIPGTLAMFAGGAFVGAKIHDGGRPEGEDASTRHPLAIGALGGLGVGVSSMAIGLLFTAGSNGADNLLATLLKAGGATGAFFGTALLAGAGVSATLLD